MDYINMDQHDANSIFFVSSYVLCGENKLKMLMYEYDDTPRWIKVKDHPEKMNLSELSARS